MRQACEPLSCSPRSRWSLPPACGARAARGRTGPGTPTPDRRPAREGADARLVSPRRRPRTRRVPPELRPRLVAAARRQPLPRLPGADDLDGGGLRPLLARPPRRVRRLRPPGRRIPRPGDAGRAVGRVPLGARRPGAGRPGARRREARLRDRVRPLRREHRVRGDPRRPRPEGRPRRLRLARRPRPRRQARRLLRGDPPRRHPDPRLGRERPASTGGSTGWAPTTASSR